MIKIIFSLIALLLALVICVVDATADRYIVEVEGSYYEVEAPSAQAAVRAAHQAHRTGNHGYKSAPHSDDYEEEEQRYDYEEEEQSYESTHGGQRYESIGGQNYYYPPEPSHKSSSGYPLERPRHPGEEVEMETDDGRFTYGEYIDDSYAEEYPEHNQD